MSSVPPAGREVALRAAANLEELQLHEAALEWALPDPILINSIDDCVSAPRWRDKFTPFRHQVQNLITFCRRVPCALLADDVGLGKTISAGLILAELIDRRRVGRALVLCPTLIGEQWVRELGEKFELRAEYAAGSDLTGAIKGDAPVVVTSYQSGAARLADLKPGTFDLLVLDEAHKLRNLYGDKPPKLARQVHAALESKDLPARRFQYVLMLTATPMQNGVTDLYSLIDCMAVAKGHDRPLGDFKTFRASYLDRGGQLQPNTAPGFKRIIASYMTRTRRADAGLQFPRREVQNVPAAPTAAESQLLALLGEMRAAKPCAVQAMEVCTLVQALFSSPHALASQLASSLARLTPTSDVAESRRAAAIKTAAVTAHALTTACPVPGKMAALFNFCEALAHQRPDWRLVVFTCRKETQDLIGRVAASAGWKVGFIRGGETRKNNAAVEAFGKSPPAFNILVSTDAGAEGVNLQVCNVLVNYDLPWNPMIVEQRIGRVQRLGGKFAQVTILNLLTEGNAEQHVVGRLMSKLQQVAEALGDVDSILEAGGRTKAKDFEADLRDLVLASLDGNDPAEDVRLRNASLDDARRMLDRNREELDRTLGDLSEPALIGPTMPKLSPRKRSVSAEEFVLRAKAADGFEVRPRGPKAFDTHRDGMAHDLILFDERAADGLGLPSSFMGRTRVYLPGRPSFAGLVRSWCEKADHFVADARSQPGKAVAAAKAWVAKIPEAEFGDAEITQQTPHFAGTVTVRARAGNGVDSYETLITRRVGEAGHEPIAEAVRDAAPVPTEVRPSTLMSDVAALTRGAAAAHPDVKAFRQFYEERLRAELPKAGSDERMRRKVREDLEPSVSADAVTARGVWYESAEVTVRFVLGGRSYTEALALVPASGQVLSGPPMARCEQTDATVPEGCLSWCAVSGRRVERHLLATSDEGGVLALPEFLFQCAASGRRIMRSQGAECAATGRFASLRELGTCSATGRAAIVTELAKSGVSGAAAMPSALVVCQESGLTLLPSESDVCSLTGRRVDARLLEACAATGGMALRHLLVTCEQSGARMLPSAVGDCSVTRRRVDRRLLATCSVTGREAIDTELGTSAISGRRVVRELLIPSVASGRLALAAEFVRCETSDASLLPDEVDECVLTGRRVDRRLLGASEASGSFAMRELLVSCEATGARLLPREAVKCSLSRRRVDARLVATCATTGAVALRSELGQCSVTGDRVVPSCLGECESSGRRVRLDKLVRCQITGRRVTPDQVTRSGVSGNVGLRSMAKSCVWQGWPVFAGEYGKCKWTRQPFSNDLLAKGGEFSVLASLLSRRTAGTDVSAWIPALRAMEPDYFRNLAALSAVRSPDGRTAAVRAEIRNPGGWLLTRVQDVGLLIRLRQNHGLEERGVQGSRSLMGWQFETGVTFEPNPARFEWPY